ncbi:MAG: c-type cytochrome [Gemmatimonadales bacterium]
MRGHGHRLAAAWSLLALGAASCGRTDSPTQRQEQQQPAASSVPHEAYVSAGGLPPPGVDLRNPHKGDKKAAEAGAGLFGSMNCDGCHGGGAVGWVGPSLADGRWRYGGTDADIYQSIYYGRPKGMPAFGGALPSDAIWMLVTYLQSLPVTADVLTRSWTKP